MSYRRAELQAVFDKVGRWTACYTAVADVAAALKGAPIAARAYGTHPVVVSMLIMVTAFHYRNSTVHSSSGW